MMNEASRAIEAGRAVTWHQCQACGDYLARIHGEKYGDGTQDEEDAPVYLSYGEDPRDVPVPEGEITKVLCGCNA